MEHKINIDQRLNIKGSHVTKTTFLKSLKLGVSKEENSTQTNSSLSNHSATDDSQCVEMIVSSVGINEVEGGINDLAQPLRTDDQLIETLGFLKKHVQLLTEYSLVEMFFKKLIKGECLSRSAEVIVASEKLVAIVLKNTKVQKDLALNIFQKFRKISETDPRREGVFRILFYKPLANKDLLPIVKEFYPYLTQGIELHINYYANLFHMISERPEYKAFLLRSMLENFYFMESSNKSKSEHFEELKIKLLTTFYSYLNTECFTDGEVDLGRALKIYNAIKGTFFNTLESSMTTHSQFIFLYLISLNEDLSITFLNDLWTFFDDESNTAKARCNACMYLGNTLLSSNFLSKEHVSSCVESLGTWLNLYLNNYPREVAYPSVQNHSLFYTVFYTVAYIFIRADKDEAFLEAVRSASLKRLVTSEINPLLVLNPTIVHHFSKLGQYHKIVCCQYVLNKNNRPKDYVLGRMKQDLDSKDLVLQVDAILSDIPEQPWLQRLFKPIEPLPSLSKEKINSNGHTILNGTHPLFKQ